jgi:hypothetical protein
MFVVSNKPGRPPLEPRIAALEQANNHLAVAVADLQQRLNAMAESFSRGVIPVDSYKQQYKHWGTNGR